MNKRGFEFSFGWLFALLVGAVILFLAIYAAVRFIGSESAVQETEAAKQLEIILTPIETGYEEGKAVSPIKFPSETRVYNNCSTEGNFGEQSIRVSTMFGKKWQEEGFPIKSYNKYIFSPSVMQGEEMYAFSKPFEMPFKVANLLFMWSDSYCLISPVPSEIEKEISSLKLKKINITDSLDECNKWDKKSKKVCFYSEYEWCDAFVNPDERGRSVKKKGRTVYYDGSLIYGAIFSEPDVYECQVERLMKRTANLAALYNAKSKSIAARGGGCSANMQVDLENLATATGNISGSIDILGAIYSFSKSLKNKNEMTKECKLWEN